MPLNLCLSPRGHNGCPQLQRAADEVGSGPPGEGVSEEAKEQKAAPVTGHAASVVGAANADEDAAMVEFAPCEMNDLSDKTDQGVAIIAPGYLHLGRVCISKEGSI